MATRFYFAGTGTLAGALHSAIIPTSWSAGWNATPPVTSDTAASSGIAETSLAGWAAITAVSGGPNGNGVSGNFTAAWRFVSAPLAAQTISGNVKGQFRCSETAAGDNYTLAVAVKVITPSGADRGVLLAVSASDDTAATPPEMAAGTLTNRRLQDSAENTSIALSSLAVSDGDRIVFEVGFRQASTSANAVSIAINANSALGDLAEDNTATAAANSWIELDTNISFHSAPYVIGVAQNPLDIATASANEPSTLALSLTGDGVPLVSGDLMILVGQMRQTTTGRITVSATGGQSWSSVSETGANNQILSLFWAKFNGTLGANPSLAFAAAGGTVATSAVAILVRDPSGTDAWEVDTAYAGGAEASAATVTITGITPAQDNNFVLAGWGIPNISTWGSLSGTNWQNCGNAQYRNAAGSDQSMTFAAQGQVSAAATNDVSKNPSSAAAGMSFIMAWRSPVPRTSFLYDRFAAFRPMLVRKVRELVRGLVPPRLITAMRAANDAIFRKAG